MTLFQEKVFKIVKQIPKGSVLSYKQVAQKAGNINASRAVGNILNKNKDYKNIPCHRVVKSDGKIGGYNRGSNKKLALLKQEGVIIINRKVAR